MSSIKFLSCLSKTAPKVPFCSRTREGYTIEYGMIAFLTSLHLSMCKSSSKHQVEEAWFGDRTMIANCDSFNSSWESWRNIGASFNSRIVPESCNCLPHQIVVQSVKVLRVSLPLKLKNTSYFHRGGAGSDTEARSLLKSIEKWLLKSAPS